MVDKASLAGYASTMIGNTLKVYETVDRIGRVCDLHHVHREVRVIRTYILAVVEEKKVRQRWAEGFSKRALALVSGFRAVDQFGDVWYRDWNGWGGDRPGDWHSEDGRVASALLNTNSGYVMESEI